MTFQETINDNINIINLLDWLEVNIRIWLFDNQFMRNIQNFLCHLIFIDNYQKNLKNINNYEIKYDKLEKLIELWVIDNEKNITVIWREFLNWIKNNIEKFKLFSYESFVKEIINSFNQNNRSHPNILKKYFWNAHSEEIVYLLLKILKNNNFTKYKELKVYIFQLINNSNINLFEKIEDEDEFYLIFFQKIFYWDIEDNTILRINNSVWKDWFKTLLNTVYKEYYTLYELLEENEDFTSFMKESYNNAYKIIKRVDYQPEIYSQPFIDIKALLFLELRD